MVDKVVPFPSRSAGSNEPTKAWSFFTVRPRRWRCHLHGDHDQVIHIVTTQGVERHYCMVCVIDLMDRLGFKNLPQVE